MTFTQDEENSGRNEIARENNPVSVKENASTVSSTSFTPAESETSAEGNAHDVEKKENPWKRMLTVTLAVPAVLIIMLLCFLTPSLNSGAHDLPLGVAGPEQVTSQITGLLEAKAPGTFSPTVYGSAEEAEQAVKNRDEIGAISLGADGITVITASGAGSPYAPLLKNIGASLKAQGQQVTYKDVAPMPAADPSGVTIASLALPLAFGGNVSAVLLMAFFKKSYRLRRVGSVLMSLTSGLLITVLLQYGFHTFEGNFWMTVGALSLGIAAISLTLIGAKDLFGFAGLGVVGFLLLFVSNPLAGLASGPQWLPAPWGTIGQMMPIGAAGTAVRSTVFFDGAGATQAIVVLVCWALIGWIASTLAGMRTSRKEKAVA